MTQDAPTRLGVAVPPTTPGKDVPSALSRLLYTVPEVVALTTLSRSVVYELLRSGRLASVCEGRRRLIPAEALVAYIHLLSLEASEIRYDHST